MLQFSVKDSHHSLVKYTASLQADLYAKVFWGGLWGALFLLPLRKVVARWWVRALIYGMALRRTLCSLTPLVASRAKGSAPCGAGCGPSLVQVLLVFPLTTPYGVGGMGLGALTPVFVFIFNTVGWSIPAYAYFRLNGEAAGSSVFSSSACLKAPTRRHSAHA